MEGMAKYLEGPGGIEQCVDAHGALVGALALEFLLKQATLLG